MCIYIYIYSWVELIPTYTTQYFLIDANFDKFTLSLHYLRIFSVLAKFQGDQRLIDMSPINFLNSIFCNLK